VAVVASVSKVLGNSLEQYFDISRMRSKEVQAALQRAEDFAIRLWTDREIARNEDLSGIITLRIISKLTRWFFDAISKNLLLDFPSANRGTKLILESMQMHNKADADLRSMSISSCSLMTCP
jgi:hypothetical protein